MNPVTAFLLGLTIGAGIGLVAVITSRSHWLKQGADLKENK